MIRQICRRDEVLQWLHGQSDLGIWHAPAARGGSGGSRRSPGKTEERSHCPRHHARSRRQQGTNREAVENQFGSILRFLSGDLEISPHINADYADRSPRCKQKRRPLRDGAVCWRAEFLYCNAISHTPRPKVAARSVLPPSMTLRSSTSTKGKPAPKRLQLAPASVER